MTALGANRTTTGWSAIFGNSTSDMLAQAQAAFAEVLRRDPQIPSAPICLAAHHLVLVEDSYVADSERYLAEAERLLDRALKRVPEARARGLRAQHRAQSEFLARLFTWEAC